MNILLKIALQGNIESLTRELSRFDYEGFNRVPAAGGWSAGQVAEHLLLLDIRAIAILSSRSEPAGRDPQEKVLEIQSRTPNRSFKLEAPKFIIPSDIAKDPHALIDKLITARKNLIQFINDRDMSLLHPDTPHRIYGTLTGMEWVQLIIHHTDRHILQIQEIK